MIPTDELEDYPKRTSARRAVPYVVVAALLVGAIGYGLSRPARRDVAGGQAPRFSLEYLDGSGTLSSEDLDGQSVVVNFWASWCIPCREETPLLEAKWQEYKDDGVRFIGIVNKDTKDSALSFVEEFGMTYDVLWDPGQSVAREFGLVGLPQTFFIDPDGTLVGSSQGGALGAISEAELDGQIEAMLAE